MTYLRLFIASVFLLQGIVCPSLCSAGLLADATATQSQPPCHDMLDQVSSSDSAESVVIAGNSRLSPEDLENIDRLNKKQKNQKNQAQKINAPKKPAQENPVEEKKAKPPCCDDDDEMLITHTSVRVDGLMAEPVDLYVESPVVVMVPVFSTGLCLPPPMQTPNRASPDLRILYSSFLI